MAGSAINPLRNKLKVAFPRRTQVNPCLRRELHHPVDLDRKSAMRMTYDVIQNGAQNADLRRVPQGSKDYELRSLNVEYNNKL